MLGRLPRLQRGWAESAHIEPEDPSCLPGQVSSLALPLNAAVFVIQVVLVASYPVGQLVTYLDVAHFLAYPLDYVLVVGKAQRRKVI